MLVYVIRHGQSETNEKGLWTGWLDAPLTEIGQKEAKRVGEFLSGVKFDKVYSSDLVRANETARIARAQSDIEKSKLLREAFLGNIEGKPIDTLSVEQRLLAAEIGYADYGGETLENFYSRISKFMNKLENSDCEKIAVFTHSGWMRGMLDIVLGAQLQRRRVRCNNCAVAIFEYDNNDWTLHSWINMR